MFMKQDIWCVYFQTRVRNGFNVPEPADHHSVCVYVSVAELVGESPLCASAVAAAAAVASFGGGGAAYGD